MSTRKAYPDRPNKCEICKLRKVLCICALMPKLDLKTKVVVLIHHRETRRPSNTGELACALLKNSEMRVRGLKNNPMSTEGLITDDRQSVWLFPSITAQEITPNVLKQFKKPLTLIVPDGNWRQASKVPHREPALLSLPHLKVPLGKPSEYKLRIETREEGLATFEAITRALGLIEGPEVEAQMTKVFKLKVERTLWARAKILKEDCVFGIPQEALC